MVATPACWHGVARLTGPAPLSMFDSPPADEGCLGCLTGHSDYVTGLAASASGAQLASGGLRGEVLLWDLERLRAIMAGTASVSR